MNNAVFITGSSGFIGSNFLNFIKENKFKNFEIVRINKDNYKDYKNTKYDLINLYHFAGFYSLDEKEKSKIYEANYYYGESLLNTLEIEKFNNLVYTNSIYSLDGQYDKTSYVKSKNKFSDLIKEKNVGQNFNFIELFLDNTFGAKDSRDKILNNIINSVNEGIKFTINNPESYINLIEIQKLCKYLFELISKTVDEKNIITSKYSYKLISILEASTKFSNGKSNIDIDKRINNLKSELNVVKINSDLENYLIKAL